MAGIARRDLVRLELSYAQLFNCVNSNIARLLLRISLDRWSCRDGSSVATFRRKSRFFSDGDVGPVMAALKPAEVGGRRAFAIWSGDRVEVTRQASLG
jgi:hypothetical protein